jgi:2,4-dienoyl-CoA reductase-like NADH-dependent reductase (Old Yellow Enzyme family)
LKLKNSFFRGAVGENGFTYERIPEEIFKLYDQLSKNEVVNILTGFTIVSDYNSASNVNQFRIDKDEYIPKYRKLVEMVHKNGANFFMQIGHVGINVIQNPETIYGPSSLPLPNKNKNSKEMTKEDILRIENDFAEGALRAKKAGFDGIEIHGAHFYLVSDFLSPIYNKRTDEYGGNDENRARFLIEIIGKIRKKVGNDFIVGVKLNCEDGDKNGITEEAFFKTCLMAEAAGIDFIDISGMTWMKERTKNLYYANVGIKLAEKLKISVMVTAGARNVDELNEILNKSNIQYFGIARPLICQYDLLKK